MNEKRRNDYHKRPLMKKQDLLILLALAVVALGLYYLPRFLKSSSDTEARIYIRNELVKSIALADAKEEDFSLEQIPEITIRCDGEGGILFLSSDCPDKLCVNSGLLKRPGDFAACLPHEVMISIYSKGPQETEEGQPDIVIGEGKTP